jgi:hypothetical protein
MVKRVKLPLTQQQPVKPMPTSMPIRHPGQHLKLWNPKPTVNTMQTPPHTLLTTLNSMRTTLTKLHKLLTSQ